MLKILAYAFGFLLGLAFWAFWAIKLTT